MTVKTLEQRSKDLESSFHPPLISSVTSVRSQDLSSPGLLCYEMYKRPLRPFEAQSFPDEKKMQRKTQVPREEDQGPEVQHERMNKRKETLDVWLPEERIKPTFVHKGLSCLE